MEKKDREKRKTELFIFPLFINLYNNSHLFTPRPEHACPKVEKKKSIPKASSHPHSYCYCYDFRRNENKNI